MRRQQIARLTAGPLADIREISRRVVFRWRRPLLYCLRDGEAVVNRSGEERPHGCKPGCVVGEHGKTAIGAERMVSISEPAGFNVSGVVIAPAT